MRPHFPRSAFGLALLVLLSLCAAAPVFAAPPPTTGSPDASDAPARAPARESSADTQQLIDTLKDPARRAVLIETLENLRKVAPAGVPSANPPAGPNPATAQPAGVLKPDSLGVQIIARGSRLADTISANALLAARAVADVPDFLRWSRGIIQNPAVLLEGAISAARLLAVMLVAVAGELLVWRLTRRFYASLAADARQQDTMVRRDQALDDEAGPTEPERHSTHRSGLIDGWLLLLRLPTILIALTVDLLPPLAFLAVATLVSGTPLAQSNEVRTVILAVVDAYVIVRVVAAVARATFGAPSARLRLLPSSRYPTAMRARSTGVTSPGPSRGAS